MGSGSICAELCMRKRDLKEGCYGTGGNYVDDRQNYGRIANSHVGSFHPSEESQPLLQSLHHTLRVKKMIMLHPRILLHVPAAITFILCVEYSEGCNYVTRLISFAPHFPARHIKWQSAHSAITITACGTRGDVGSTEQLMQIGRVAKPYVFQVGFIR